MSSNMSPLNGTAGSPRPEGGNRMDASSLPNIPGLGGAIAGLAGGLAMMVSGALIAGSMGRDMWLEARQISTVFYGSEALTAPGMLNAPVIVGTIVHFLIAAALGALFGIVSRRVLLLPSDFGAPVLAGLIYGMLVWMVAYFIILPFTDPALLDTYAPSFIVQNLVFGIVTGLVYARLRPSPYTRGEPAPALAGAVK